MIPSAYLETIIAIVFVFLLFSVIALAVQEWWAAVRELRGRLLQKAIEDLLNDRLNKSFGVLIYEHPQIDLLRKSQKHLPSYVPAAHFATALIELVGNECIKVSYVPDERGFLQEKVSDHPTSAFERFKQGIDQLKYSDLKVLLQSFLQDAENITELRKKIEEWYNQYMNRVSGWYKEDTKVTLRIIAVAITLLFNIDTIYLVQNLYGNSQLRATLVNAADKLVDDPAEYNEVVGWSVRTQLSAVDSFYKQQINALAADTGGINMGAVESINKEWADQRMAIADSARKIRERQINTWIAKVNDFDLPIGWDLPDTETNGIADTTAIDGNKKNERSGISAFFKNKADYFEYYLNQEAKPGMPRRTLLTIILGWFISATCISFGAPFWFDILNKAVNLRRAGLKPKSDSTTEK